MIRWFARNDIAANFLLIGILFAGLYTVCYKVPLQVEPSWEFESINISMDYRGGTADDVQRYIVIPIEEAIKDITADHYVLALYGQGRGKTSVKRRFIDYYDEVLSNIQRQCGTTHQHRAKFVLQDKYVNFTR